MRLVVNGRPVELDGQPTVSALLAHLNTEAARVAVERNEEVVPRREWDACRLLDGDRIEIVTFVGGG
jgi:thiamine biosynthesis protein ThiS